MKNFKKLPHKTATGNKRHFTTTTKYYANRDEEARVKNEKLLELKPDIKTSSHSADERSQSSDQLFDLLKKNKRESQDNCYSADLSMHQADEVCSKASNLFTKHKTSLTNQEREEAESNLNLGAAEKYYPTHSTEEEKSISDIDRYLKRLVGAMYRAKTVQDVIPNRQKTNEVVSEAEFLVTELNTLSHNIQTLTHNNDKIRTELRNRNISLIEDQLTTFMDMPGDISDNVD